MPPIRTQKKLNDRKAPRPHPVYFAKHIHSNGYLSQWAWSPFTYKGETFNTAEIWMMVWKARLFKDEITAQKILQESDQKKVRKLGRSIKAFDPTVWDEHKYDIVKDGTRLKFKNCQDMREALLATGDKEIVEAAKWDRVWGIGYARSTADANRENWGLNLLGQILQDVRSELRNMEGEQEHLNP